MVTTTKTIKYYTADEFMALSLDPAYRYELVRGEIKTMSQPGEQHGAVSDNLHVSLGNFVRSKRLGRIYEAIAFELHIPANSKDTVRSPDLAFVVKDKLTGKSSAIQQIPDLIVEVYSPNDRPGELREKLEDYQQAGWDLVGVIYPPDATPRKKASTVDIYRLQEETGLRIVQTLEGNAVLRGEGVLEGFSMLLNELFDIM